MRGHCRESVVLLAVAAATLTGAANALTPTDPQAAHPSYAALNLPSAWDVTTGSPDVVVAVVDTGVQAAHPDLTGAVLDGYDFVDEDTDAADPPGFGHGTAVAGVVAARANNGLGGVGACFDCSVLPIRVVRPDGFALNTDIAAAVDYAVDHGAAAVNVSLYGERSPAVLREAIVRARAAGVLVVAAAGNEASARPEYPAAFPETIAVGSASGPGQLASFSSRGDWVDLAAPACAPLTTLGGGFGEGCATSVSTPLVAGIVALLRANAPYASSDQLEEALATTARPVPGTRFGLVDAAAALTRLGRPAPRLTPLVVGDAIVGEELEAFSGLWSRAGVDVTYRWEECRASCSAIPGATTSLHRVTRDEAGYRLRVVLTSSRAAAAVSDETRTVAERPSLRARPSIAGPARVGARLVARLGEWAGTSLRYSVTWLRCRRQCTPVAEGSTYRVRTVDRGGRLRVEVTAANSVGTAAARSKPSPVVR